ncbi:MAG: tRNA (N(6)-L-threonylcarbamoyladenosine(37)-C(2))-methylthiotransferase MtaB [Rhodobiaceae bacterium]|nr:tRNA (N(6)-L-threonylcarbamoyladenosine(37)-C(2))-methylthiotransferase MtaB [Rhodobiaceae bacterium]
MTPPNVKVENFGCRLNALEGDSVQAFAQAAGLQNTTIINGCAVTGEAMRQARQAARKAKRANPEGQVIVTGCAAQTDAEQFIAMPEVDRVIGNEEKLSANAYSTQGAQGAQGAKTNPVSDIMSLARATPLPPTPQTGRSRAFVQVQTGCDHRCTFCIIPFGRGNSRSVPVDDVVARCQLLVDQGHKEIVLTGVDVTSYGPDIGEAGLGALVRAILTKVPELPRLRLSSIDAVEIDGNLLDMVIAEPRLMPHLHLSLQAGDNMILKRMKRRHTREEAIDFCAKLKQARPDIAFGADLIAGFPTETDAMFENSIKLVEQCELTWLHVFPYSPRPDTPAARMPQLDGPTIKARAAALRQAGDGQRQRWLDAQHGQTLSVLVEKQGDVKSEGRSGNFARVQLPPKFSAGELVSLRVSGHDGLMLSGDVL